MVSLFDAIAFTEKPIPSFISLPSLQGRFLLPYIQSSKMQIFSYKFWQLNSNEASLHPSSDGGDPPCLPQPHSYSHTSIGMRALPNLKGNPNQQRRDQLVLALPLWPWTWLWSPRIVGILCFCVQDRVSSCLVGSAGDQRIGEVQEAAGWPG